jgi:glucose/arabinose dehydrogenase
VRRAAAAVLLPAALLLTACGGGYTPAGPFRDVTQGEPPQVAPPPPSAPAPVPSQPTTPGADRPEGAGDPNVLATDLAVPTGIAVLPDGSAIVGERDTGRLLQVFPDHSPAKVLMTVPGIDSSGEGGLLGLAVSPTYDEDDLVYAYISTATDNRVVRFPIGGTPNPVFTGIPHGDVDDGGALLFGPDGTLYIGTGDTGNPALAADPASLAGKVLAVDAFGKPAAATPVFTRGHRNVTGLCVGASAQLYAADAATSGPDELDALTAGRDYSPGGDGRPVVELPEADAGLGGCAVGGTSVFLGALDGKRVTAVALDDKGTPSGDPTSLVPDQYGRLRSVAVDPAGGLWITTSNRDGVGTPMDQDDKVLRILPPNAGSGSPL